jgi:hypothetical protein
VTLESYAGLQRGSGFKAAHPEFQIRVRLTKRNRLVPLKDLQTYLQDHFAGSVAGLEIISHLIATHSGDCDEQFFIELRQEIEQDQETLKKILQSLGAGTAPLRNTTAYFAEKFARLKVRLEDPGGTELARLEQIEALALGIEGKGALWNTLQAIQENAPALRDIDFCRLSQRADAQRKRVEARRIQWARGAFKDLSLQDRPA